MEIGMNYYISKRDIGKYKTGQYFALAETIKDKNGDITHYRFYPAEDINNSKNPEVYIEIENNKSIDLYIEEYIPTIKSMQD